MANILIGSSNVSRFYHTKDHSSFREYKVVKCTHASGFKAYMSTMGIDKKAVLISVIENFVVDSVGAATANPDKAIIECVTDFLKVVTETAARLPGTKFAIVMPMRRPALAWYQEKVELITKELDGRIQAMTNKKLANIGSIECLHAASQLFEEDLIHLTGPSSKVFLEWILDLAEDFFGVDHVNLSDDEDEEEEGEVADRDNGPTKAQVQRLELRLTKLENESKLQHDQNFANNMMFARIREEIDLVQTRLRKIEWC
jgi:hypothetical protein